jgi:hypothetical protein
MAVTAPAASSPEPGLVRVPSDDGALEFSGQLIGSASTEQQCKPRWVELALYQVTDGTGRYILHRVGRSLAYHRAGGPCNRGVVIPANELMLDAQPCPACRPPARSIVASMPGATVAEETDYHATVVCDTPEKVLDRLRMRDPMAALDEDGDGMIRGSYSEPAQRLLQAAQRADPAFGEALNVIRRLR